MNKNFWQISAMIVGIIGLLAAFVIDSQSELKKHRLCKELRIIPITEKYFSFEEIYKLVEKGEYQPKCI